MLTTPRSRPTNLTVGLVSVVVLTLAFLLGQRASILVLGALIAALGAFVLLARPALGLFALVVAALVVPLEFSTGTDVTVNPVTLLIPVLGALWLLDQLRRGHIHAVASPVNRPLILFLGAGLLSLLIGRANWDPMVPVKGNFILVQFAQWAIFAFSALTFWLAANLVTHQGTLWRLTAFFLLLGGGIAVVRAVPGLGALVGRVETAAFIRAPFWLLLVSLVGGQLLWNRRLSWVWRAFLFAVLFAALVYSFVDEQEAISGWVGIGAALSVLVWLRFPRLRWPLLALTLILVLLGVLLPAVFDFAGGKDEWFLSGGSRLVLIERVIDVTMRNPITGLGPAAYRPYAAMAPLPYQQAVWAVPRVNSHNNYVDLFSQVGLIGLAIFGWVVVEIGRLSFRLQRRFRRGFAAAYVNGMIAAGIGALVLMMFADWILPFVYNIQFTGFQASVLVWLFLGGLVALENMPEARAGE